MKRNIEVFTAGRPLCNDTLKLVRDAVRDSGCNKRRSKNRLVVEL